MTIHLPPDLMESVRAAVQSGRYASEEALVAEALRAHLARRAVQPAAPPDRPAEAATERKPIWEQLAELHKDFPEEAWANLPVDGSAQVDHYIYGSPKRLDP